MIKSNVEAPQEQRSGCILSLNDSNPGRPVHFWISESESLVRGICFLARDERITKGGTQVGIIG